MSHPQRDSTGEDMVMGQKGFPVRSFSSTACTHEAVVYQQPYVSGADINPAATSLGEPEFLKPPLSIDILIQGTSSDARALVQTDKVEEATGHVSTETNIGQTNQGKRRSFVPLYQAALKGDWSKAKREINACSEAVQLPITKGKETALHIAAAGKHTTFVKELVKRMSENDLKRTNKNKQTALYFAAASGTVTIAKEIVNKNCELTLIRSSKGMTPLYIAALLGHKEMVTYLFGVTPFEHLSSKERIQLLVAAISNDWYEIALEILKNDPSLAKAKDGNKRTALHELAKKPFAIDRKGSRENINKTSKQKLALQLVEDLWHQIQQLPGRDFSILVDTFLFDAAASGNAEFLIILFHSYPDIIWKTDKKSRSIFHIAVLKRQETVFNLIYDIGAIKDMILTNVDDKDRNILHLAGKSAPKNRLNMVSGAALQMQRELLWFKEVERIVAPSYRDMKTLDIGLTPWDLFIQEHVDLRAAGEKWMKDTVNFYIIVATLISAVVFAAAFTVPGGSTQDTGNPICLKSIWFKVFFISDAIALLSSSTSILIYLSILTSRFTEMDFHVSLPLKWVLGVITLVISIVGMMVAFSATCFLVFKNEMVWLPIIIIALAGVPIVWFVLLHFKVWADIIRSTYSSRFLFVPQKYTLFSDDQ